MPRLTRALERFPVVALVGSRQAGKTTLAKALLEDRRDGIYLDLELPSDVRKLSDPELFLAAHADALVVLDEIHQIPDLFPVLRALVDQDRRAGRFLVLGSASADLLRQTSESLAGRITYLELPPFVLPEVAAGGLDASSDAQRRLWLRGGYPDSYLAESVEDSRAWRHAFIRTFLERDLPRLGVRVSAERMHRFWQMLAHVHGQVWNANTFARNFDVSAPTVRSYLDLLSDTYIVRQLRPWHGNLRKRLVKSPKVFLRDSGLLHTLLGIGDAETLQGHPVLGASFEGFAIEQILRLVPDSAEAFFYRTHGGAELDLVLDLDARTRIGVEIKYTVSPKVSRGMREALTDTGCTQAYVVTAGRERFPLAQDVEAVPLSLFLEDLLARAPG